MSATNEAILFEPGKALHAILFEAGPFDLVSIRPLEALRAGLSTRSRSPAPDDAQGRQRGQERILI
jgi:hypothetical protein